MTKQKPLLAQPLVRRHNLSTALRNIWEARQITRTELAAAMGLSKPAITRIVADLVAAGYVHETEHRPGSGRGRPSLCLELRPREHYFIGIDYRLDRLVIQARDFDGTPLLDRHFPPSEMTDVDQIVVRLADLIKAAISEVGYLPSGIGMSLPGTVTADRSGVMISSFPILNNTPLAILLRQAIGPDCPPILLDDVASCAAIANWREIAGTSANELVHIQIGIGAGLGYASRSFPVGGSALPLNRFGHLPLERDGPKCRCGARGCLNAVAGFEALTRYAAETGLVLQAGPDAMNNYCAALLALHNDGDPAATQAIATAADWLGRGVASLCNLIRPSSFSLGGYPLALGEAFLEPFLLAIEPFAPGSRAGYTATGLKDDASILGALLLGMNGVLTDPLGAVGAG